MPRPPRLQAAGVYHITTHSIRGSIAFKTDRDRLFFLILLERVCQRCGWRVLAYCLMDTHYHLLVDVPEDTLSTAMQRLNGVYARWFNDAHGYTCQGHVFAARFYSGAIEGEGHLLETLRYIVLNPVRAGLCALPGGWRWSSHRAVAGAERCPAFLHARRVYELFSPNAEKGRQIYVAFVGDRLERAPPSA